MKIRQITDECKACIEKSNNARALVDKISSLPEGITLDMLIDGDGFSLLHKAVFTNKSQAADALIK